jgi:DNA-binding MarR family transcriptional regulator
MPYDDPQPPARSATRLSDLDAVATTLLGRTSRLTRLLMRTGPRELTRTEAGVLETLSGGELTIGQLAETEALTQPAVSKLVDRLERRRLVARHRAASDGRFVLVSITAVGLAALERRVEHVRKLMHETLSELPPGDLASLLATGDVLERLIQQLQRKGAPR